MEMKFSGKIESGKFYFDRREDFDNYSRNLADGRAVLMMKRVYKNRTSGQAHEKSNQNGYYWAAVIPILCDYFGYDNDEMHEALKYKFLRIGGDDYLPRVKRSSQLNSKEWEEWMEAIRIWAITDFNIKIPTVEEYYYGEITY